MTGAKLPDSCRPKIGTPMEHLRLALAWARIPFDYERLGADREYYEQMQEKLMNKRAWS